MGFLNKLFKQTGDQGPKCIMCGERIYGEETVISMQSLALGRFQDTSAAQRFEQKSGYRCKSCGKEYCKDCLERKAPSNSLGGKSCPKCGGLFEIMLD